MNPEHQIRSISIDLALKLVANGKQQGRQPRGADVVEVAKVFNTYISTGR